MREPLDVALIGAGRMGAIHARNVAANPRLRLRAVVDPAPPGAQLAAELNVHHIGLEDVLSERTIAGLVIASPADAHLEHCLLGLKVGKAVFCEKPIDLDLETARAAAPAFHGAAFVLGFNRRYDPCFRRFKAQLDAGAIGRVETLTIINHDPSPPPPAFIPRSGGLFKDFTIHDLDLAAWLLDEPFSELFAAASCLIDASIAAAGDVDTAKVILRTQTGRLCVISNSRRSGCGYDQRIEAFGASGMLQAGNERTGTVSTGSDAGAHAPPIQPDFLHRYAASYRAELDHFADVAAGLATPLTGFSAGLDALALSHAAGESCRRNAAIAL